MAPRSSSLILALFLGLVLPLPVHPERIDPETGKLPGTPYIVSLKHSVQVLKPLTVRNKKAVLEVQEGSDMVYTYLLSDGSTKEMSELVRVRDDRSLEERFPKVKALGEHWSFLSPVLDVGAKVAQVFTAIFRR